MITGIHHISLKCCSNEEFCKVVNFYTEILGIPVKRKWERGIMLDTGSGIVEISKNAMDKPGTGAIRHFALLTDDVDACVKAVSEAGCEITDAPHDVVLGSTPEYPIRIAFCKGPLGEEIEFFQER